jgi:hypothetical protein
MPLPAQHTQETNIHALSWIRTRDPSNREAADLRLRPHGHRDPEVLIFLYSNFSVNLFYITILIRVRVTSLNRVEICSTLYTVRYSLHFKFLLLYRAS